MSYDKSNIRFLVTGGAGFIGSAFMRLLAAQGIDFLLVDALTYAGNPANVAGVVPRERFVHADITDMDTMERLFRQYQPTHLVNFAAETHVDRSVEGPLVFVRTNVEGTQVLLECARKCPGFQRFVQVSTDEVYGDLPLGTPERFTEASPLHPSSPYSASKAGADMLALSYHRTFGTPVVITRCSNNYGPRQFPEKLIPLMINNMLEHRELPVYGDGLNVRDWIHVVDHCRGILAAALDGTDGEVYNFGADCELANITIVKELIATVRDLTTDEAVNESLIRFVGDRPGHDRRYAIDSAKARGELGWKPVIDFAEGLRDTVRWYLDNRRWVENIVNGSYREYYARMYGNRGAAAGHSEDKSV